MSSLVPGLLCLLQEVDMWTPKSRSSLISTDTRSVALSDVRESVLSLTPHLPAAVPSLSPGQSTELSTQPTSASSLIQSSPPPAPPLTAAPALVPANLFVQGPEQSPGHGPAQTSLCSHSPLRTGRRTQPSLCLRTLPRSVPWHFSVRVSCY